MPVPHAFPAPRHSSSPDDCLLTRASWVLSRWLPRRALILWGASSAPRSLRPPQQYDFAHTPARTADVCYKREVVVRCIGVAIRPAFVVGAVVVIPQPAPLFRDFLDVPPTVVIRCYVLATRLRQPGPKAATALSRVKAIRSGSGLRNVTHVPAIRVVSESDDSILVRDGHDLGDRPRDPHRFGIATAAQERAQPSRRLLGILQCCQTPESRRVKGRSTPRPFLPRRG
jgi:hypothetical protein